MKIALIMLAAGNSRRFGRNKLLYEIEGKPMYRHILEKLLIVAEWLEETECIEKVECGEHLEKQNEEGYKEEHIECNKVIAPLGEIKGKLFKQRECYKRITVVTQYEEIEQAARSLGVNVYINPHPDEGISSSLKIGLKANLDVDACLFTVSDQPWLTIATIRQLITLLKTSGKGIACVSCEGKLGNPCIFTKKYYDSLLSINGDKGGKAVITAHRDDTVVLKVNDVKELTDMDVILTDAFGIVALVAMTPLCTIQLLGLYGTLKARSAAKALRQAIREELDGMEEGVIYWEVE